MSSVKASSPLEPAEFIREVCTLAVARGFRVENFGTSGDVPLVALTKRNPGPRPRIYLSAGIHGDEPAPPLALKRLLEAGFFDERATWFICPLLNPVGMAAGTRENGHGIDLNRDYRKVEASETRAHVRWLERQPPFDVSLCLHEDWEAKGFYLYEINPRQRPTLAEPTIVAVANSCLIDSSEMIDGREARGGIIRPDPDPSKRELWAEATYLHAHHSTLGYTMETPSAFPLEQRILAHCAAVETGVARLMSERTYKTYAAPSTL